MRPHPIRPTPQTSTHPHTACPPPTPHPRLPISPDDELLLHWRKVGPILPLPPPGLGLTGWRDPFVLDSGECPPHPPRGAQSPASHPPQPQQIPPIHPRTQHTPPTTHPFVLNPGDCQFQSASSLSSHNTHRPPPTHPFSLLKLAAERSKATSCVAPIQPHQGAWPNAARSRTSITRLPPQPPHNKHPDALPPPPTPTQQEPPPPAALQCCWGAGSRGREAPC